MDSFIVHVDCGWSKAQAVKNMTYYKRHSKHDAKDIKEEDFFKGCLFFLALDESQMIFLV